MPKCPRHKKELEPDGLCHKCLLERSEKNAKQFPAFAKKHAKIILGKKRKKK